MTAFRSILAAVDLGDLTARVLHHAAGLAGAAGARLTALHVVRDEDARRAGREALERAFAEAVPYTAYGGDTTLEVRAGEVVPTVLAAAAACDAPLIVAGSHGRRGVARRLLGSTSAALLEHSTRPLFLVPDADMDVVSLAVDRAAVTFGAVLAAVDLDAVNTRQLVAAAALASLARQPLQLLTVARTAGPADRDLVDDLRRAAARAGVTADAFIVRRGHVAEEIARCALAEQAGLVVMGVRPEDRGQPGALATAVLATGRAFVLAVPA